MKKTILKSVTLLFTTLIVIPLLYSCTEEFDYGKSENAVKTLEVSAVLQTSTMVSGLVITDNNASLSERGICYSTNNNPSISDQIKLDSQATLGSFTCNLINLSPSTTYFARACATNEYGTAYGGIVTFTTQAATIPIISSTTEASLVTQISATTGGIITNSGASKVTSRGVCYSNTSSNPTILNSKTNDGTGIGQFTSALTNLSPKTIYYIRAYATNGVGTAYGDVKTFVTTSATIPLVSATTAASFISLTTAFSGGTVTTENGASITSRGVCWSNTNTSPTITNSKTVDGSGIGTFASSLSGLLPSSTYYVRAYATNSIGTAYGTVIAFKTLVATIPTGMTTSTITSITQTTAKGGGNISSDGGATITSYGICWSNTTSNPTITNSKTIDGTGVGSFTSSLASLSPSTTYYVRAYATNSVGTTYGSYIAFTTTAATLPIVSSTTSISAIAQNTASGGGTISSDGGSTVTSRGVCFSSTTSSPTIYNTTTNDGSGIGSFTSAITGLSVNTTYYIRAYATNNVGTSYGIVKTFTTLAPTFTVGQSYQGGVIAYLDGTGQHGLIAAPYDQSTGAEWGCNGTFISGADGFSIGTGNQNTVDIMSGCSTSGIAARLCGNLVFGGYSDWYLPSKDELYQLYINRAAIGGFANATYWSSSEYSAYAYYMNFSSGSQSYYYKNYAYRVRAVRTF